MAILLFIIGLLTFLFGAGRLLLIATFSGSNAKFDMTSILTTIGGLILLSVGATMYFT